MGFLEAGFESRAPDWRIDVGRQSIIKGSAKAGG
jgi:hypothetical protein